MYAVWGFPTILKFNSNTHIYQLPRHVIPNRSSRLSFLALLKMVSYHSAQFSISNMGKKSLQVKSNLTGVLVISKGQLKNIDFRGHSKTTWTIFCPILTTYLPIMDFSGHSVHYLPFVHVDIEKTSSLPPCLYEFDNIYYLVL